jgi:hypothetical protein
VHLGSMIGVFYWPSASASAPAVANLSPPVFQSCLPPSLPPLCQALAGQSGYLCYNCWAFAGFLLALAGAGLVLAPPVSAAFPVDAVRLGRTRGRAGNTARTGSFRLPLPISETKITASLTPEKLEFFLSRHIFYDHPVCAMLAKKPGRHDQSILMLLSHWQEWTGNGSWKLESCQTEPRACLWWLNASLILLSLVLCDPCR